MRLLGLLTLLLIAGCGFSSNGPVPQSEQKPTAECESGDCCSGVSRASILKRAQESKSEQDQRQ